jgi:hypothetical protein
VVAILCGQLIHGEAGHVHGEAGHVNGEAGAAHGEDGPGFVCVRP